MSSVLCGMLNQRCEVFWDGELYRRSAEEWRAQDWTPWVGPQPSDPIAHLQKRMVLAGRRFDGVEVKFNHLRQLDVTSADLLMDLRQIPDDVDIDVEDLGALIDDLTAVGRWRSVVLLGTTMPRSLGGGIVEAGTVGRLPRKEWLLWLTLRHSHLSRVPIYGDYAVHTPSRH